MTPTHRSLSTLWRVGVLDSQCPPVLRLFKTYFFHAVIGRGWPATCTDDEWWGRSGRREEGKEAVEEWHHLHWNVTIISSLGLAVYRGDIILFLALPLLWYWTWWGRMFLCVCACSHAWERPTQHFQRKHEWMFIFAPSFTPSTWQQVMSHFEWHPYQLV